MASIFTRIIEGELPGTFVWRDDRVVAFLSIDPAADGHILVVPREEVDHWIDLEPDLLAHLTDVARRLGRGIERAFGARRIGLMVEGFEVPHAHLHVLPIDRPRAMEASNLRHGVDPDELARHGEAIRTALTDLGEAHGC